MTVSGRKQFDRIRFLIKWSVQNPESVFNGSVDMVQLNNFIGSWKPFSESYAYAWQVGVFPILNLKGPHHDWEPFFTISEDQVREIYSFAKSNFETGKLHSLYEYENYFKSRGEKPQNGIDRMVLISCLRYFYLMKLFNKHFWDKLLTPNQYPSEGDQIKWTFLQEFPKGFKEA